MNPLHHTHTHTHVHTHTHTHTCTHTHTYARAHTHTHNTITYHNAGCICKCKPVRVHVHTDTHTHTFLVMFAGKPIDYLDNCDRDAFAHSSHQCVPSPTKCYDATGTNFEARVYPARNRLAQACVLLFYSHNASAQITSAAWVPGTGPTRI